MFKVQGGNSAERILRGAKDIKDIIFRQVYHIRTPILLLLLGKFRKLS